MCRSVSKSNLQPIYLDYQSTTPCDDRVVKAMLPFFNAYFANYHSNHQMAHPVEKAVEQARYQVADLIGAQSSEIIFTSGATEANNLAIKGAVRHQIQQKSKARRVITVSTEHKTVLESVLALEKEGIEPFILSVDRQGMLDPNALEEALQTPTLLVSIMAANNETGVLHPIKQLSALCHKAGAIFHCDLVQILGKLPRPVNVREWDIDLASISAHKLYGPKGIGALYVRRKPRIRITPLFSGGGQERGLRSGTLPVPLIIGFGVACQIAKREGFIESERFLIWRKKFIDTLQTLIPGLKVNGSLENRLPGSLNLCFPKIPALDLLRRIPQLCVSTSSACLSADIATSYVLRAMGLSDEEASRSFRLCFGRMTHEKEVEQTIKFLYSAWRDAMAEIH